MIKNKTTEPETIIVRDNTVNKEACTVADKKKFPFHLCSVQGSVYRTLTKRLQNAYSVLKR